MAPRKVAEKPAKEQKNAIGKPTKKKCVKEKPKLLKIPTVVKVRVPLPTISGQFSHLPQFNSTPTEVLSAADQKIHLANEVANAQLVKPLPMSLPKATKTPQKKPKAPTKTPKKQKDTVKKVTAVKKNKTVKQGEMKLKEAVKKEVVVKTVKRPIRLKRQPKKLLVTTPIGSSSDNYDEINGVTNKLDAEDKLAENTESVIQEPEESKTVAQKPNKLKRGRPKKSDVPVKRRKVKNTTPKVKFRPPTETTAKMKTSSPKMQSPQVETSSPKVKSPKKQNSPQKGKEEDTKSPETPTIPATNALGSKKFGVANFPETKDKVFVPIESRKTSITSCSSISWTKDISSSSAITFLTVSPNDFYRIDNRLPVVELVNCDKPIVPKVEESSSSSSSSDDSSDSSSDDDSNADSSSSKSSAAPNLVANSLNLSSSSLSSHARKTDHNDSPAVIIPSKDKSAILHKLSALLQKTDLNFIQSISCDSYKPSPNIKKFQDSILKMLEHENYIVQECRSLKSVLSGNSDNNLIDKKIDEEPAKDGIVCNEYSSYVANDDFTVDHDKIGSNEFVVDKDMYGNYEYDNEDALSIFAGSITDLDNSKNSVPSTRNVEEYIPQPVGATFKKPTITVYNPTRITSEVTPPSNTPKTVCEKQNADSTSVYQQTTNADETKRVEPTKQTEFNAPNNEPAQIRCQVNPNEDYPQTGQLMCHMYRNISCIKSYIFRGICFFNLIGSCKNQMCQFRHIAPVTIDIKNKLAQLDDELFIREYMLLRNWPSLRREYVMLYVDECTDRQMTRMLVEMSIDSIIKANKNYSEDAKLRVMIIEQALLHLNNIDLKVCEDLLKMHCHQSRLCDTYMETIANTQNFSRFKSVFIKLTKFIEDNGGTFNSDVAGQILERVSILPFELPLANTLLKIIDKTDAVVFENSSMKIFETQLMKLGGGLYEMLREIKQVKSITASYDSSPIHSSPRLPDIDNMGNALSQNDRKRYTSPDTTKMDAVNKSAIEQKVIRTDNVFKPKPHEWRNTPFKRHFNDQVTSPGEIRPTMGQMRPFRQPMMRHRSPAGRFRPGYYRGIAGPRASLGLNRPRYFSPNKVDYRQVAYRDMSSNPRRSMPDRF